MRVLNLWIVLLLAFMHISSAAQELKVAAVFSDNMVLQQQTQTPIWGWRKKAVKSAYDFVGR